MPIRPENRGRYPDNWSEIRAEIMERARDCCEGYLDERGEVYANAAPGRTRCGAPHRTTVLRTDFVGGWRVVGACRDELQDRVRIILTIAHLDHQPENNDRTNLRAFCQRCHNRWDREHRAQTRAETRRREARDAGQVDLFGSSI